MNKLVDNEFFYYVLKQKSRKWNFIFLKKYIEFKIKRQNKRNKF